jgi:hypothetical protein
MANKIQLTLEFFFFSESYLITDRFHIVKLVMEAYNILRIQMAKLKKKKSDH